MTRQQDLSWEALVSETNAQIPAERGRVNKALSEIRAAMPDLTDGELATEIVYRAGLYRRLWPEMSLSANALSLNWARVVEESKPKASVNAPPSEEGWSMCSLCGNMGIVFLEGTVSGAGEECAPCPRCERGKKAEAASYGAEGMFWGQRGWTYGTTPHTVQIV